RICRRPRLHVRPRPVGQAGPGELVSWAWTHIDRHGDAGAGRHYRHRRTHSSCDQDAGSTMTTAATLETRALNCSFEANRVITDVNFTLRPGERRALIGPNGAGKTTFLNLLTG